MAGKIKVPSELVPSQSNKVMLRSKYVYDDVKGHTQEEVNQALEEQIESKVIEAGGVNWDTVPTAGSNNAVKSKDIKAALEKVTGYFVLDSNVLESTVAKTVTVADFPALALGGSIKIKMLTKNTATNPTLRIGPASATAYPLYYNNERASANNTWEENEVISVYFDGTNYQASNAQGSGGKAEKIKYDNSTSGLAATDVQGALDIINVKLTELRGNVYYGKSSDPLTFEAVEDGTFSFSGRNLLYSIDGGSWNELTAGENTPTITAGSTIAWKTPEDILSTSASIGTFSSSGKYNVLGNIMSLLFTEYVGVVNLYYHTNVFQNLFVNGKIVEAKDLQLPATTLSTSCYCSMFEGNQYMVSAPALPALTATETCYWKMFKKCASLVSAPALPATTLGVSCYQDMFNGCSSLTIAPELPATDLKQGCYLHMFAYCTSLTSAPVLPAEYINNYAYGGMFSFCSNLAYVEVYAKSYQAANSVAQILNSVARTGTIVKYEGSPVPTPSGWTTEYITE